MANAAKLKDGGQLKQPGKIPADTLHGITSQDSGEGKQEKTSNQKWNQPQEKAVVKLISYLKELR